MIPMGAGLRKCFVIDGVARYPVELCNCCRRNIVLVPTAAGKRQPRDSDGRVHFATCPCREQKRRPYTPPGQLRMF